MCTYRQTHAHTHECENTQEMYVHHHGHTHTHVLVFLCWLWQTSCVLTSTKVSLGQLNAYSGCHVKDHTYTHTNMCMAHTHAHTEHTHPCMSISIFITNRAHHPAANPDHRNEAQPTLNPDKHTNYWLKYMKYNVRTVNHKKTKNKKFYSNCILELTINDTSKHYTWDVCGCFHSSRGPFQKKRFQNSEFEPELRVAKLWTSWTSGKEATQVKLEKRSSNRDGGLSFTQVQFSIPDQQTYQPLSGNHPDR